MNSASKIAALLLLFGIAGCRHNVQTAAVPPPPAKVYTPNDVAKQESLPQAPPPKPVEVKAPGSEMAQQQPAPKLKKAPHRKSKSTDSGTAQTAKETTPPDAPATTPEASMGKAPDTSPIGQLTSSSESSSTPSRQQIQDLITKSENGLNGIRHTLTSDEQETAAEIRTFLAKAKKALDQDDLDGAYTLVTKAKVLLDELMTKE